MSVDPVLRLKEQAAADSLRSQLMLHIWDHVDEHAEYMVGDALNADMPRHIPFQTLHDRVFAMAAPTAMVGEFEISQTSKMLERPIIILDRRGSTLKYGSGFAHASPVYSIYTAFGDNAGHYGCVLPPQGSTVELSNPSSKKTSDGLRH